MTKPTALAVNPVAWGKVMGCAMQYWGNIRSKRRTWIGRVVAGSALVGVLALAGCESVDEGVTDYRKATIDQTSAEGKPTDVSKKYMLSDNDKDVAIVANDTFYVSLLQAYVGPDADFRDSPGFGGREEIVLVLRVRDSNEPDSPGRFAFYSDDVARGQFLNFSNLLTLGPTRYHGGVITIDVDEVRLIGTTAHIKEKLRQLADDPEGAFGPDPAKRRNWNALARNVFDIIDSDSYGTRYTLTLLPSGGIPDLPYPRFEAGNYVLMRHEARNDAFEWNALQLDNNTGRLVYRGTTSDADGAAHRPAPCPTCDPDSDAGDYRARSYVTLQVNALRNVPDNPSAPDPHIKPPRYRSLDKDTRGAGQ
ncbi:MAG: hypothetical protein ACLQUZ_04125 [Rhizomicrobium sp.]